MAEPQTAHKRAPSRPPSASLPRTSILPQASSTRQSTTSSNNASAIKNRNLAHLHSQLAQLSANLADMENLVRMTAVQAESMRGLGGWCGGLFMAASKEFEPVEESTVGGAGNGNKDA